MDRQGTWSSVVRRTLGLLAVALALGACGSATVLTGATTLPEATSSPAASPTAMAQFAALQSFTCPATVNGTVKTFSDTTLGVAFSYPASWTESDCQRGAATGGSEVTVFVGNLFILHVIPRNGMSAQQFVATQQTADQRFTLTPLTVKGAQEAYTVTLTQSPSSATPPTGPLAQARDLIVGTQSFYVVSNLIAQVNTTDSVPTSSDALTAVVQSFVVS